jgi:hypothetical protein
VRRLLFKLEAGLPSKRGIISFPAVHPPTLTYQVSQLR